MKKTNLVVSLLLPIITSSCFVEKAAADNNTVPSRILFGSCLHQDSEMPILKTVRLENPDLFIFLGDNIYGDTIDMDQLKKKYQQLDNNPNFYALKKKVPSIAIWDDHDYGANDAGADYPQKEASRQIMLDFWQEPTPSSRRTRDSGIYTSYYYGSGAQSVQIILPDLRWNRPTIKQVSKLRYWLSRHFRNMGPYQVHDDPTASMLGEQQWQWLEAEMKKPAAIKIIASSLQLIPEFTGWEAWANFPYDRNRLLKLIDTQNIPGVIFISGDTHWGELSLLKLNNGYPLWEVTSSGLTEEWKAISPNRHREGDYTDKVNYGVIDIHWDESDPLIEFGLKNIEGEWFTRNSLRLSALGSRPAAKPTSRHAPDTP